MSTKKILSVAAASAIIITGLSALEIEQVNDGTEQPRGGYVGGEDVNLGDAEDLNISEDYNTLGAVLNSNGDLATEAELLSAGALLKSKDLRGDALIYPYFAHKNGWGTEITVRNTTPNATVAKAVIYRNDNSQEMIDFNIYLSPFDSATFTIKDNKITTSDRSFATDVTSPALGHARDNVVMVSSEYQINPNNGNNGYVDPSGASKEISEKGYVIIYGMTQYNEHDYTVEDFDFTNLAYHSKKHGDNAHADLWKDYRSLLDACRTVYKTNAAGEFILDNKGKKILISWREPYQIGGFEYGSMMNKKGYGYRSPNVAPTCSSKTFEGDDLPYGLEYLRNSDTKNDLKYFGDVAENTLTGTVRLYNAGDGKVQARDMRLPATALRNFTSNQMILWTEGEWAGIQDRRLLSHGKFNKEGIQIDARSAFYTKSAYFTFEKDPTEKKVENKLIVTQPMKRVLTDLLLDKTDSLYWEHFNDTGRNNGMCLSVPDSKKIGFYDATYGGFNIHNWVVDNDELVADDAILTPMAPITSPYTVILAPYSINCEVAELGDEYFQRDELINDTSYNYDKDGFAYVNFTRGGQASGLPAIVTQMTGSKVGGVSQTNWIYAPTIK